MSSRLHALAIPFPLESHCSAMASLCIKLASRGIVITFVATEASYNSQTLLANAQENGLDIQLAQVSDGLPFGFNRSSYNEGYLHSALNNMIGPTEELIHCTNRRDHRISCIIADAFLPWTLLIAKKYSLPLVSLWTQSSVLYTIYYHSDMLISNGHFPSKPQAESHGWIDYIPAVPPLYPMDLPSFLQATDVSDFMLHIIFLSFQSIREADWVLCNSVFGVEIETMEYSVQSNTPFLTVGPLLSPRYFDNLGDSVPSELFEFSTWLDSKPQNSVIYVTFGNSACVTESQIEEIAMGLLESQHSFIWMLPPETVNSKATLSEILPYGFLEQIKDNGFIVPTWSHSEHLAVISHRSVGGFFTHCDWNSILESICMGVPMLGFPLYADQYTNCKFVSDEMSIALKVKSGGVNGPEVDREQIASHVKALIQGGEGRHAREKIRRLAEIARKAAKEGGSSDKNIQNFVEDLAAKVQQNQE